MGWIPTQICSEQLLLSCSHTYFNNSKNIVIRPGTGTYVDKERAVLSKPDLIEYKDKERSPFEEWDAYARLRWKTEERL